VVDSGISKEEDAGMITDDENRGRYYLIGQLIEDARENDEEWKIVLHKVETNPQCLAAYLRSTFPPVFLCTMVPKDEPIDTLYDSAVLTDRGVEVDLREWFQTFWPESEVPKFTVTKYGEDK
jgi:hypothetical protein